MFNSSHYMTGLDCGWVITNNFTDGAIYGQTEDCTDPRVAISFISFDVEQNLDYLAIYDGDSPDSTLIGRFDGTTFFDSPGTQRSESNSFFLAFHSDDSIAGEVYDGFSFKYKAVCGEGTPQCRPLSSPMDMSIQTEPGPHLLAFTGEHYEGGLNCAWLFQVPPSVPSRTGGVCEDAIVVMEFVSFNTEQLYDYVSIYDGNTTSAPLLGRWTGTAPEFGPGYQSSTGNAMLVTFHSDETGHGGDRGYEGFNIEYDYLCRDALPPTPANLCSPVSAPKLIEGDFDEFHHINFTAFHYLANMECGWKFVNTRTDCAARGGPIVQVDFEEFHTESLFDFITIVDGSDFSSTGGARTTYSGAEAWESPQLQRSTGNTMMVSFKSDETVAAAELFQQGQLSLIHI